MPHNGIAISRYGTRRYCTRPHTEAAHGRFSGYVCIRTENVAPKSDDGVTYQRGTIMKLTLQHARLILGAGMAVMSAIAGATVNKCVDQNGEVLFTDTACPQESRLVDSEVSDGPAAGVIINTGVERVPAGARIAAVQAPRSRWADLPRPLQRKAISVDAGTLQTARMNLQMQDEMHKQRRVASTR